VLGEDDYATIGTRFNMAVNYARQGRDGEAEAVYREVLEIGRQRFGEASQLSTVPMTNLHGLCRQQGRYDEAAIWSRRLLEIRRRHQGQRSESTIVWMLALASDLERAGVSSEAESLYTEALEVANLHGPPIHEANARLGLARIYLGRGETARADRYFEQVLLFNEQNESASVASAIAAYYVLADDHDMAIESLKKAVELGHARASIAANRDFAPLHGHPEFEAIIADVVSPAKAE
jgi:tetratricopeptide (TPR) repeat protein